MFKLGIFKIMTQSDEKNPIQSLVNELADLDYLLNSALAKATHLGKNPRLSQFESSSENTSNSQDTQQSKFTKPSNWGQLKDLALEDSMKAMEEDERALATDTTKVRTIKPKNKTSRIDDNWEDEPI